MAAGGLWGKAVRALGRSSLLSFVNEVFGLRRVDLDAGAHRRRDDDRADVAALGGRRLRPDQLLEDRLVVAEQLLVVERGLADDHVDDRGAIGAVLDLAGLGLLDGLGDVHRDRADLRVRHLPLGAEDAAETADDGHHVRRRDRDVEVGEALVLDARGEVLGAYEVGAGLLGLARLVALGEDGDRHGLAEAVRERDRAAQLLVRVADVQPGADVHLDGLVVLGALGLLEQPDGLAGRVELLAVDLRAGLEVTLAVLGHQATTSTPIERAVPAMILAAWSTSFAFRSGSFFSAIWRTWASVIVPTLVRFGSPEPFSMPIAWRIRTAAGGVFVTNVKERSSKTVMTTGIVVPASPCVWALNALTNSMMLMPCWPSAGPTGGAGEAWPPGACSLMVVRTFFMTYLRGHPAHESERRRRGSGSYLLDLVVAHLDGRLAAKDRYQHLQLARVLVDLGDLAREVRQGAGDDLDRLADVELRAARGPHRDLAVQQAVDLGLGQRDRLVGRAHEAGDARRALDHLPRVLVEVHVHQHVAGHRALLDRDLLVVLHLLHRLRRHDDLAHGTGLAERGDAVLEVLLDLVLVPGVGVDDVPAKHGFLDLRELEDGVDERLPQRVEQAEVAPGDDDEAEHDRGRLTDLAPVGPLHAT